MEKSKLPQKFELDLDKKTILKMTDKQLDEYAKKTNSQMLIETIKTARKNPDLVCAHYKGSWSYSTDAIKKHSDDLRSPK